MKNNVDKQYLELLQYIIDNGVEKKDRTGTGTISIFDYSMRFNMSEGFPLLTSKKMFTKAVIVELMWFLRGDTNIKYLVDNGCNIWNGDAYKNYEKYNKFNSNPEWLKRVPLENGYYGAELYNIEEFVEKIKTDDEFASKWGELGPVYGKQWRGWNGVDRDSFFNSDNLDDSNKDARHGMFYKESNIDQIQNLINNLRENPDSRRLIVNAWNVSEIDEMILPPCHYGFQCYTTELSYKERYKIWFSNNYETGFEYNDEVVIDFKNEYWEPTPTRKLDLKFTMRSCDVPLGIPFNIASYGFLLHLLAREVNMIPGDLIFSGGDCHIYLNQLDGVHEQIKRETFELPRLVLKNKSINDLKYEDFELIGYKSSPVISYPLSN